MPQIISDIMPETEHVDGRFYTSKSMFRKVTRANGLTEVGNEKHKPKLRASTSGRTKETAAASKDRHQASADRAGRP